MARATEAEIRRRHDAQLAALAPVARRAQAWRGDVPTSLDALRARPPMSKADLLARPFEEWVTGPVPPDARWMTTSGTTGEPFAVPYAPGGAWRQGVLRLHVDAARGIRPWHRVVALAGRADRRPGTRLRTLFGRHTVVELAVEPAEAAAIVRRARPDALVGHPDLLLELAERTGTAVRVSNLVTFGETLTPEAADRLEAAFGAAPLDTYGLAETGLVAWQCRERDLYHLDHDGCVVEVLDDGGAPAREGRVVVTPLWNPLFPLYRYDTNDGAVLAERACRCGYALPAFERVDGRILDWLVTADGQRLPPQRAWLAMYTAESFLSRVARYRVVQAADGTTRVEVVAREPLPAAEVAATEAAYRALLGFDTHLVVVDDLRPSPGKRFRQMVSERA